MHPSDHSDSAFPLHLPTPEATAALGAALAQCLLAGAASGLVIWLEGELGAGKTALVRATLRALGHAGPVKSPTFTLLELYKVSSLYCYHFDFYRFNEPREFQDAGLGEYFDGRAVCFVEWPDKAAGFVPAADLRIRLVHAGDGRELTITAKNNRGQSCLDCLRSRLPASISGDAG